MHTPISEVKRKETQIVQFKKSCKHFYTLTSSHCEAHLMIFRSFEFKSVSFTSTETGTNLSIDLSSP